MTADTRKGLIKPGSDALQEESPCYLSHIKGTHLHSPVDVIKLSIMVLPINTNV